MFLPVSFFQNSFTEIDEINLSPTDLGLQRGYSIFDFFKLRDFKNPWIEWYLERLQYSCATVGISLPFSNEELKDIFEQLLSKNKVTDAGIKIIVTAGSSSDGYSSDGKPTILMLALPVPARNPSHYENGVHLLSADFLRSMPTVKSTNYLHSAMLAGQMKKQKAVDVLYHYQGVISEASRCNFYIVQNNEVKTSSSNILKGITRRRILSLKDTGIPIIEEDVLLSDLANASEAFISSTTKGVLPVRTVGDIVIGNGKVGEITKELMTHINSF